MIILVLRAQSVYSADSCKDILKNQHFSNAEKSAVKPLPKPAKTSSIQYKSDVSFQKNSSPLVEEYSLREGPVAAHIYLDSENKEPYIIVGFPAGNSGVALWFTSETERPHIKASTSPKTLQRKENSNGIEIDARSGTKKLTIGDSVLGSMRFIRDRELDFPIPTEVATKNPRVENGKLILERKSINGFYEYLLELEPQGDTHFTENKNSIELTSQTEVKFKIRAFSSEPSLTAIPLEDVFTEQALKTMDPKSLQSFSFLLFKEKLMAGSPRYFSKFGRDSIYTLGVLMRVMKPEAIESLLTATISSMHPKLGLISHEQHEGDFASFVRLKNHKKYKGVTEPIEDYKMIDDDFAFTIVLSEYLNRYPERAKDFLDRNDQRGFSQRSLINKLFNHVIRSTDAFRLNPIYKNLVSLKGEEKTGQWRDSENGLGGGKYPYDVNAVFVPSAIKALAELSANPDSDFFDKKLAITLNQSFEIWNTHVSPLFKVHKSKTDVEQIGQQYLRSLGIDEIPPSLKTDIIFPAISLDKEGRPIPIMHSDDSIMMAFGFPSEFDLSSACQRILLQFPYGLGTPVGILVANPIFASEELKVQFDETKYHGRVSWTMQEDLLLYGIFRQLERTDLSSGLRNKLERSKSVLEKIAEAKSNMGGGEVFSIDFKNSEWVAKPFKGDARGNSNQLWSHLSLWMARLVDPNPN